MSASRTAKSAPAAADTPASYEQAVAELDDLVQRMESGQLSLDDTLAAYKRGNLLLQFCRARLQAVEQQVQVLDGDVLKPFGAEAAEDADRG